MKKLIMSDDAYEMVVYTMELTLDREEETQKLVDPNNAFDVAAFADSIAQLKQVMVELDGAKEVKS